MTSIVADAESYALSPDASADLESAMRDFIGERPLELYRFMEYQLGWIDDGGGPDSGYGTVPRRHGMLCLNVAAALGASHELALRYAVSLELIQAFATIHGDVQDGNSERLGRPTVWWKWGPSQAINTGDGMHALARLSIFELAQQGEPAARVSAALQLVDDAVLKMCEGEFLDVQLQEKLPVSESEYTQMVELRVGSLYGAAAALPALLANGETADSVEAQLRSFGRAVGVARQMEQERASMFDSGTRQPIEQGRMIAKKKTLPIALTFDAVNDATTKRKLGELYLQRVIDPERLSFVTQTASELGIDVAARDKVSATFAQAESSLVAVGLPAEAESALIDHARELIWGDSATSGIRA